MYVVMVSSTAEKFHIARLVKAGHVYNKEIARRFAREWTQLIGYQYKVVKA